MKPSINAGFYLSIKPTLFPCYLSVFKPTDLPSKPLIVTTKLFYLPHFVFGCLIAPHPVVSLYLCNRGVDGFSHEPHLSSYREICLQHGRVGMTMKPLAIHDALVQLSLVTVCDTTANIHPKDITLTASNPLARRKKRMSLRRTKRAR